MRAPVTLGVAAAAVLATILLGPCPQFWSIATNWLIHADLHQLAGDVGPWLILGLWLEARIGSRRWAMWTAAGVAISTLAHAAMHPLHDQLFGLSATIYFVGFAGLLAVRDSGTVSDRSRRLAMLVLAGALADELVRGGSAWRALAGESVMAVRFVDGVTVGAVPWVHVVAAAAGVGVGLATRWLRSGSRESAECSARAQSACVPCR